MGGMRQGKGVLSEVDELEGAGLGGSLFPGHSVLTASKERLQSAVSIQSNSGCQTSRSAWHTAVTLQTSFPLLPGV